MVVSKKLRSYNFFITYERIRKTEDLFKKKIPVFQKTKQLPFFLWIEHLCPFKVYYAEAQALVLQYLETGPLGDN